MKKVLTLTALSTLSCTLAFAPQADAYRATKTLNSVTAKADLPYFSDFNNCGNYKAYSSTTRKDFKKLQHHVTFNATGGSVSFGGVGVSGSGTSPGYSKSTKSKTYYSSGNVCGSRFIMYLGMSTTTHVEYSNRTYTATAKI